MLSSRQRVGPGSVSSDAAARRRDLSSSFLLLADNVGVGIVIIDEIADERVQPRGIQGRLPGARGGARFILQRPPFVSERGLVLARGLCCRERTHGAKPALHATIRRPTRLRASR